MGNDRKDQGDSRRIDTAGAAYVEGTVQTGGGDFVGRDQYKEEHYHLPTLTTEIPFQAPRRHDQYVERPAELKRLKELLLPVESGAPPPVSRAVLHGIAAVGKSVLTAAFARDEAVRKVFPDGVLWVTLGTRPNLPQRLADWGCALGDPSYHLPNERPCFTMPPWKRSNTRCFKRQLVSVIKGPY